MWAWLPNNTDSLEENRLIEFVVESWMASKYIWNQSVERTNQDQEELELKFVAQIETKVDPVIR